MRVGKSLGSIVASLLVMFLAVSGLANASERDTSISNGWIIDETLTPLGDKFFQRFTEHWEQPQGMNDFSINIIEQPIPTSGLSSRITVKVGDLFNKRVVYRGVLSPRRGDIEDQAKKSIANIEKLLDRKQKSMEEQFKRLERLQKMTKWKMGDSPLNPNIVSRKQFRNYDFFQLKKLSPRNRRQLKKNLFNGNYRVVEVRALPHRGSYAIQYDWMAFKDYEHKKYVAPAWEGYYTALRVPLFNFVQVDVFLKSGNIGKREQYSFQ